MSVEKILRWKPTDVHLFNPKTFAQRSDRHVWWSALAESVPRLSRGCAKKLMGFLGDFYRIYVKISKPKSQWTIVKMLLNPCLWVSFASVCLHIKDNHWCSILLNENVGDACCSPKKVSEFEFFFFESWIIRYACLLKQTKYHYVTLNHFHPASAPSPR